jgi:hypothetical protein
MTALYNYVVTTNAGNLTQDRVSRLLGYAPRTAWPV